MCDTLTLPPLHLYLRTLLHRRIAFSKRARRNKLPPPTHSLLLCKCEGPKERCMPLD
jgi:hypothetical protein